MTPAGRHRRWAPLASAAVAALAMAGCAAPSAPPPTARVDRGDVVSAVTAAGSLVAVGEQKLGFRDGGKVTEVLVKVGDRVEPGQVLARLDDFALRQTLSQRQASLDEQAALLGRARADRSVPAAEAALAQARDVAGATEDEVAATNEANASASGRARAELKVEQEAREQARRQLSAARAACAAGGSGTSGGSAGGTGGTGLGGLTGSGSGTGTTTCDTSAAESAVLQAESAVVAARSQVVAAEHEEDTGAAAGRVSVENARQGVVSAQNELDSARSDRPFDVAEQQALVDDARAGVAGARRDVDEAVLTAPGAGVVTAINGVPGEFVAAPSATTAQAPGGTAALPATSGDPTGTDPLPGTGAFLVLAAANAFEVVVPFEETDAVRLVVGQQVDITVDALVDPADPARTAPLRGHVLAVAPTGQVENGIVTFWTTISLENPVERLRAGMTADAAVRTEVAQNVLRVPNAAVGRTDGRPSVTVTGPDGDPRPVPFDAGLVGRDYTEVRSGLRPGEEVLLPQARVSITADPAQGPPGGG